MTDDIIERVRANPRYHALARERSVLGGILSAIVLAGFIAFILMMGFARHFLGEPMVAGSSHLDRFSDRLRLRRDLHDLQRILRLARE